MEKIELPEIDGITVPNYVQKIADGKYPNGLSDSRVLPADQPSLKKIQHELEALTKSDSSLIQKYVGLYHQIRLLKEEVETYNQEASRMIRTEEERKKYAVRRTDIPANSHRSQTASEMPHYHQITEPGKHGGQVINNGVITRYSRHKGRHSSMKDTISSMSIRNDSVNSIFSSNSSASSVPDKKSVTEDKDFEEISMPEEGELSNLDVQWFLNYNGSLSRKPKQ